MFILDNSDVNIDYCTDELVVVVVNIRDGADVLIQSSTSVVFSAINPFGA